MLHTDAFNKSNKRKMTKADYIKNTSLPGVASEVLDVCYSPPTQKAILSTVSQCFFDNIVFAPFIFIEDPLDLNPMLPPSLDGAPSRRGSTFASPNGNVGAGTGLLKNNRIDPYYLIIRVGSTHQLLGGLHLNVFNRMNLTLCESTWKVRCHSPTLTPSEAPWVIQTMKRFTGNF